MNKITDEDIIEALQKAAQDFGIKKLAPLMDKQPSTLYGELNPWSEPGKMKMGLIDSNKIMEITNDFTALKLQAARHGFRLMAISASPDRKTVSEELCQDTEKLGDWAKICGNPVATEKEIRLARQELTKELDETEALKLAEIHGARIL